MRTAYDDAVYDDCDLVIGCVNFDSRLNCYDWNEFSYRIKVPFFVIRGNERGFFNFWKDSKDRKFKD